MKKPRKARKLYLCNVCYSYTWQSQCADGKCPGDYCGNRKCSVFREVLPKRKMYEKEFVHDLKKLGVVALEKVREETLEEAAKHIYAALRTTGGEEQSDRAKYFAQEVADEIRAMKRGVR